MRFLPYSLLPDKTIMPEAQRCASSSGFNQAVDRVFPRLAVPNFFANQPFRFFAIRLNEIRRGAQSRAQRFPARVQKHFMPASMRQISQPLINAGFSAGRQTARRNHDSGPRFLRKRLFTRGKKAAQSGRERQPGSRISVTPPSSSMISRFVRVSWLTIMG